MNPQDAIDLGREAVKACFLVGGPVLMASLVIGLIIGIVQAMTQVQDQTVSFVPKLLCLLVVLGLCLPWLTDQMVDYTSETLSKPMTHYNATISASSASFVRTAENPFPQDDVNRPTFELPRFDKTESELKSPFILPHYRYSRLPKENIDG